MVRFCACKGKKHSRLKRKDLVRVFKGLQWEEVFLSSSCIGILAMYLVKNKILGFILFCFVFYLDEKFYYNIICGVIAGAVSSALCNPTDLLKVRHLTVRLFANRNYITKQTPTVSIWWSNDLSYDTVRMSEFNISTVFQVKVMSEYYWIFLILIHNLNFDLTKCWFSK